MTDREVRLLQEDKSFDPPQPKGKIALMREKDAEIYVSRGYAEYTQPQPNDIAVGACAGKHCACEKPICQIIYKTERRTQKISEPNKEMAQQKEAFEQTQLTVNREHATFHLEILGEREEYCLFSKNETLLKINPKDPNAKKTAWLKKDDVIPYVEKMNNQGFTCWISLNDKEHGKDNIEGVKALCDFWTDVDGRAEGKENHDKTATKEELQKALETARTFKDYIENNYAAIGFIAFSGNGFHLHFPLPIEPLVPEARQRVNEKLKAFTNEICEKNHITVDPLDYTRRVTTLIGSYNQKIPGTSLKTAWAFDLESDLSNYKEVIAQAREQNSELSDTIFDFEIPIKTAAHTDTVKPHLKLDNLFKIDKKLYDIFNGNFQQYTGDSDRSDAEMGLVCSLIGYGFSDKEIIDAMDMCKIGKWQEKDEKYHNVTLKNAHKWIDEKKAKEQKQEAAENLKAKDGILAPPELIEIPNSEMEKINDLLSKGWKRDCSYKDKTRLIKPAIMAETTQGSGDGEPKESQADRLIKYCLAEAPELFFDQHSTQYVRVKLAFNPLILLEKEPNLGDKSRCHDVNGKFSDKREDENKAGGEKKEESPKVVETPLISRYRDYKKKMQELNAQLKEAKSEDESNTIIDAMKAEKEKLPKRNVIMPIESQQFRKWLAYLMYEAEEKVPGGDSVRNAITALGGKIQKEGRQYTLYNRVAPTGDGIFLDMCDDSWRAIKVTAEGWEIVNETPFPLFKRYAHQQPLVEPLTDKTQGDAWKLLDFINIKSDDENSKLALLCSVISYWIPLIAHPAIVVSGAQGTCKSWFFNVIRQVIDPSSIPLLTVPKDNREMAQHLEHNWLTPYDNISSLPSWASDMLCRAVTGGGIAVRKLYTDDEDIILNFKRCIMLNGINVSAQRGDLLDRSMIFALEPISKRKTEKELLAEFEKAKPIILTGFLNALSQALKIYPSVELKEIQRLSDFHFYGCAIAEALGKNQDKFSEAYREKVTAQNEEALNDQVALAVLKFAELTVKPIKEIDYAGDKKESYWSDQPSALFAKLNYIAVNILGIDIKLNKGWPRSPNALTRRINALIPNLKAVGVEIVNYPAHPRQISIDAKNLIVKEPPKSVLGEKKRYCRDVCVNFRDTGCKKPNAMFAEKIKLSDMAEVPKDCPGYSQANGGA